MQETPGALHRNLSRFNPEEALLVREHPEWETAPFESQFQDDFGAYDSLADMFRQIGYDEALHRQESEIMMTQPRYA